jgi:DnaJ-class molecular chaperone
MFGLNIIRKPEKVETIETVCTNCNGTGKVYSQYMEGGKIVLMPPSTCPICDGKCTIRAPKRN